MASRASCPGSNRIEGDAFISGSIAARAVSPTRYPLDTDRGLTREEPACPCRVGARIRVVSPLDDETVNLGSSGSDQ